MRKRYNGMRMVEMKGPSLKERARLVLGFVGLGGLVAGVALWGIAERAFPTTGLKRVS